MTRKCQVRFGGGPTEKARQRDLAGGLPDADGYGALSDLAD